jgi:hypothetical protein
MQLRFGLLQDRRIDAEVTPTKNPKHLVSHRLRVIGGMEDLVQMLSSPAQFSPQLQKIVADQTVICGHCAQYEIATCARLTREVEVASLV